MGVVGPAVREHLAKLARRDPDKLIFIDSRAHVGRFTCGTLKPNAQECLAWQNQPPSNEPLTLLVLPSLFLFRLLGRCTSLWASTE